MLLTGPLLPSLVPPIAAASAVQSQTNRSIHQMMPAAPWSPGLASSFASASAAPPNNSSATQMLKCLGAQVLPTGQLLPSLAPSIAAASAVQSQRSRSIDQMTPVAPWSPVLASSFASASAAPPNNSSANRMHPCLGARPWQMNSHLAIASGLAASGGDPRPDLPGDISSAASAPGGFAMAPPVLPAAPANSQGQSSVQVPCIRKRPLSQLDLSTGPSPPPTAPAMTRRRMRSKAPPPVSAPAPQMDAKDAILSEAVAAALGLTAESSEAKMMVYLIAFPHTVQTHLIAPEALSREAILYKVRDSMAKPIYANRCNDALANPPEPDKMLCGREDHSEPVSDGQVHKHDHVGLLAVSSFRFMLVKRALLERHGLASHWSCTHDGYHSVVRYIVLPSQKKPEEALDMTPVTWCRSGPHPPLLDAANEPNNVVAFRARRERKVKAASANGKADPRAGELDLYHIIVEHRFRNTPDHRHAHQLLIQHLQRCASPAVFEWAFRNRARLPALIDDVWAWETVDDAISRVQSTRVEQMIFASRQPCVCGGRWPQVAYTILRDNGFDASRFWHSIFMALHDGRREDKTVMVLVGRRGGEGKSFLYSPLMAIFGTEFVQSTMQKGNFPLMDIFDKRIALLDEWRFDDSVLDMSTQLLWFEGKPLTITLPQNQGTVGHRTYKGTAPIFITTKEEYLRELVLSAQLAEARDEASEATMLLRRLTLINFSSKLAIPKGVHIPPCGACFSKEVLRHAPTCTP